MAPKPETLVRQILQAFDDNRFLRGMKKPHAARRAASEATILVRGEYDTPVMRQKLSEALQILLREFDWKNERKITTQVEAWLAYVGALDIKKNQAGKFNLDERLIPFLHEKIPSSAPDLERV